MNIDIEIDHPSRVHFFRYFIGEMKRRGHHIVVNATDKDVAYPLLESFGIPFNRLGSYGSSLFSKFLHIPLLDLRGYRAVKKFRPDIFLGSFRATHLARMFRKPGVLFEDDDYGLGVHYPLADAVIGFSGLKIRGPKIIRIDAYKELAYLHEQYFTPDPAIPRSYGLPEKYILLRFVSWSAYHDVGKQGFDDSAKQQLIHELEPYGDVYISSEKPLPPSLQRYQLRVPPEHIHHLIFYARLLVGDSQTMTTEAALLGTPVIRSNSFVGENDMGNFIELEKKYGLIYNIPDPRDASRKAIDILRDAQFKSSLERNRAAMLKEKIDVNRFMIWFVEEYPESFFELQQNPDLQYRFR
jgi:predicted glycosyltransferase